MELLSYPTPPEVRAFTTTREGGVSTGHYGTMNISHYCGDLPEHVTENRRRLAEELGIAPERLIVPRQVHDDIVRPVGDDYFALPAEERAAYLEGVDAVMTDLRGVCLGVSTADCVPVLLYDTARGVVAAAHAGWRGTVKRIVEKTVRAMEATYGSAPADLHAVIGPSISPDAFEVGDEVYDAFSAAGFPMNEIAQRRRKWHIDLWAANYLQLEALGLPAEHIAVSGICTYSNPDTYFSARRLGIESGRLYSGIVRK